MRTTAQRLTALTGGLVIAVGGLTIGTAPTAAAATCYGGAVSKTFNMGTDQAEHRFGPYTTTSRCNDINLKITSWGNAGLLVVRVCFHPSSGGTTCNSWKEFYKSSDLNQWRVIAGDVKDGTRYSVSMDLASNTFKGDLAH
ncbi:hypothetical protein [Streptomyces sp. NPDC127033]|uniref:hypothetical protein n=1 Tax=Streptomyces sp. NPDC127033 TaxID=3347110 RepID=UPI00365758EF